MAVSDTDFHFVQGPDHAGIPTPLTEQPAVSVDETNAPKSISFWASARQKLLKDHLAVAWGIILILIVLVALIGPQLQHYDPNLIRVNARNVGPSTAHWFGTDRLGRDLFTRTCIGIQVSLLVAILSTVLAIGFGTIYGMVMAFFGGWVDEIMMRIIEVFNSLPGLLITMLIMVVLGNGMWTMLFALALTSWSDAARQARGLVMQLRQLDYVTAAVMLDTPVWRIMTRHLVPNMMSILILDIGQSIPGNIFGEASLSFLGLGIQAPNTSLGILIASGQDQMLQHPLQLYIPILVLVAIVFAFNIVGDGLRDALDPKFQG
ncbi:MULTISPECIES: ABC transporter permease [Lacticaseibacillus]|uniref:ABC transporter permease n=2 Tax=Lacticaseibacillus TaxID=2759736 RepID=A0AAN1EZA3_LACCA|nr:MULTISPECIES: ABC transporter permease [Lacticaseibacillus]ARY91910.1 diguanylate cyclase [Lacticaseibacillus casei]KAB1970957.1 ABC transporter permease [Lacticaseibacillus casei]WLV79812.1 ABC transporter permease [Lacticaseibacillus sp. NCIMB 15473]WNX23772.1 ABC transporter permease [Lacticaseibacillus casei]WNX26547.1 ABC transporter permease [Lacticaseibacillus casei]